MLVKTNLYACGLLPNIYQCYIFLKSYDCLAAGCCGWRDTCPKKKRVEEWVIKNSMRVIKTKITHSHVAEQNCQVRRIFFAKTWHLLTCGGRVSGSSIWLRRNTTRCMAIRNSCKLRAPSLVTSESCQIFLSSCTGRRDFSKNIRAIGPANNALVSGWRERNWAT